MVRRVPVCLLLATLSAACAVGTTTDLETGSGGAGGNAGAAAKDASPDVHADATGDAQGPDAPADASTDSQDDALTLADGASEASSDAASDASDADAANDAPADADAANDAPADSASDASADADAAGDAGASDAGTDADSGGDAASDAATDADAGTTATEDGCPGADVAWTTQANGTRTASVTGDTTALANDFTGYCSYASGRDAVYSFSADVTGTLVVTVTPSTSWDPVVYAATACSAAAASSSRACADDWGSGHTETTQIAADAGKKYSVFVDGAFGSSVGAFRLDATLTPTPASDRCGGEVAVWTGTTTHTFTASGDTSKLADDLAPSCTYSSAGDAVYEITPDMDGLLTVTVAPTGWNAILDVTSGTCAGTDVACTDAAGSSQPETFRTAVKAGTTYWAIVDGSSSAQHGAYTITATVAPVPPEDLCPGVTASWTGTSPETFTATGNTSGLTGNYAPFCAYGGAADAVYSVTPDHDGVLTLSLAPTGYDPVLLVTTGTCATGTSVACVDNGASGTTETWSGRVTAGTTYYAVADGFGAGSEGAYTFTATLSPAPDNDSCAAPSDLTLSGAPLAATITGDTTAGANDTSASCTGGGRDVVYHLVAPQTGTLKLTLTPTGSPAWDPSFYVRTGSCTSTSYASELTCRDSNFTGQAETRSVAVTQGTDYWLVVDAYSSSSYGAFTLALTY